MKLIYLGFMYSDDLLTKIKNKNLAKPQMAPHTFGKNLIGGFLPIEDVSVSAVNVPPIGSFPVASKKLLFKRETWANGNNLQIGYINLPLIKKCIIKNHLKKALSELIKDSGGDVSILIYSLYEPFLDAAIWAKKKHKGIKIYLIQTDCVPGREDMDRFMTAGAKKRGDRLINKAKVVDGFVVLTKYLAEALEVGDRPFCVTECVCDFSQEADPHTENRKICLYTGSLAKEYGLIEMAEAFKTMDDAELWICGGGELENYFSDMSNKHQNIKYFGFVPQHKIAEIRQKSNYLINPRRPSGTYTKYSFPSKTAEYMASGKPVIMYKLEGIPDEYDDYLNYLSSDSPEAIAEELKVILSADYGALCDKAKNGRDFIRENASPQKQARKIINMINEDRKREGFAD